jgi:hypothetical protein
LKEENEARRVSATELITRAFAVIMVVLYLAIGTTIIVKASEINLIREPYASLLGAFLILYGLLRAYKLYRRITSTSEEV